MADFGKTLVEGLFGLGKVIAKTASLGETARTLEAIAKKPEAQQRVAIALAGGQEKWDGLSAQDRGLCLNRARAAMKAQSEWFQEQVEEHVRKQMR